MVNSPLKQVSTPSYGSELLISVPEEFTFAHCQKFLNRNKHECLHQVDSQRWIKLLKLDQQLILVTVSMTQGSLRVQTHDNILSESQKRQLKAYITEVFDLKTDLSQFYRAVKNEEIMAHLTQRYYGLRLIGIPDLFEALCWCVIGQQINLNFAYQLKKQLVYNKGERLQFKGVDYYTFPEVEVIAEMSTEEFAAWKFSNAKAQYIIGIAQAMLQGQISKEMLLGSSKEDAVKGLTALKGVGPWSAHYVMMKCCRENSAYPIDDVGLQNAVKIHSAMTRKPTKTELLQLSKRWNPWQAYATFYLWHSLI
ncbi:MAG: DNA-3-methyladenine glycosylase [Cyclobacteriaceae bacterium]|nr:MAG: DNA-3-methyladenine glycosylase [Cyclobacteriaceae bacterium]